MGGVKGGGYMILLPMVLILLERGNRKSSRYPAIVAGTGVFSVLLFDVIIQGGRSLYQFGTAGSGYMTASFAFVHPLRYLKMLVQTYLENGDELLLNMNGTRLGWGEAVIPATLIVFMIVTMCFYAIYERDRIFLQKKDKYILLCVIALLILFTPVMLLSWTPEGSKVIQGLQGRYFLPALIPALAVITKFSLKAGWPDAETGGAVPAAKAAVVRRKCLLWFCAFATAAVYYMLRVYMCR